jgi:hypothetical protein
LSGLRAKRHAPNSPIVRKTAKVLGITFPPLILSGADEVIE